MHGNWQGAGAIRRGLREVAPPACIAGLLMSARRLARPARPFMSFRFKFYFWLFLAFLALFLVVGGLWMNHVTIDFKWLAATVAIIVVAALLFRWTNHLTTPARVFIIETAVSLKDPLIPYVGRHTFHAVIRVKETRKGQEDVVNQKTIRLAFRGKSAEQFRHECMDLLARALEEQRAAVKAMDPQAVVVVQATPQELIRRLPTIEA